MIIKNVQAVSVDILGPYSISYFNMITRLNCVCLKLPYAWTNHHKLFSFTLSHPCYPYSVLTPKYFRFSSYLWFLSHLTAHSYKHPYIYYNHLCRYFVFSVPNTQTIKHSRNCSSSKNITFILIDFLLLQENSEVLLHFVILYVMLILSPPPYGKSKTVL